MGTAEVLPDDIERARRFFARTQGRDLVAELAEEFAEVRVAALFPGSSGSSGRLDELPREMSETFEKMRARAVSFVARCLIATERRDVDEAFRIGPRVVAEYVAAKRIVRDYLMYTAAPLVVRLDPKAPR